MSESSITNRNRIRISNGSPFWLSVPVLKSGKFGQKINEAEIDNSTDWRKKHLETLRRNYRKSPYFDQYFPNLSTIIAQEWRQLSEFNTALIKHFMSILQIDTPLLLASGAGISGKSTELILDMCIKTDADAYLHGKHARDYVDFALLANAGISNRIQDFSPLEYRQQGNGFFPNLSIIDILFNCGSSSLEMILKSQNIVTLSS